MTVHPGVSPPGEVSAAAAHPSIVTPLANMGING